MTARSNVINLQQMARAYRRRPYDVEAVRFGQLGRDGQPHICFIAPWEFIDATGRPTNAVIREMLKALTPRKYDPRGMEYVEARLFNGQVIRIRKAIK